MATKKSRAKSSSKGSAKESGAEIGGPNDPVTRYARAVLDGSIVAGPHVRNACRRHMDDLENGHARGLYFDLDAANDILRFCREVCRLKDGQFDGKPFIPHTSQEFILGSLYGWKKEDGFRRFRRAYIEMGKGNGKSPMAAAIGLYGLVADGESGAQIYAAGKDKAQAFVLFQDAVSMVRQSKLLNARLTMSGGTGQYVENIAYLKNASFFRVISREGASSGPRPTVALCDELHEHPNSSVIEMLERGFKFRRQPLLVMITNSGFDRTSVCWDEHLHACAVAAGVKKEELDDDFTYVGQAIDDTTFSYVCALDKNDDPFTDPSCWVKANPLLGVILTREYMEKNVAQAGNIPSKRSNILRLHFCVWTESETTWIPRPLVERVMEEFDPYADGREIDAAGADLSRKKDLTAIAFVRRNGTKTVARADGEFYDLPVFDAWVECWTPRDTMDERGKSDNASYRLWSETYHKLAKDAGDSDVPFLFAPPGATIRYDHVAARVADVNDRCGIGVIAYDKYSWSAFEEALDVYGVTVKTRMHPQGGKNRAKPDAEAVEEAKRNGAEPPLGLWMPGSVAALETLILEQRIRIRANPIVLGAIMAAHVETDPRMGNQWLSKTKSTLKIDPLIALCMAVGAAVDGTVDKVVSVFEIMAREAAAKAEKPAAEDVQFPAVQAPKDDDEAAILANPRHPKWQEARQRYEARLSAASDDDW